MWGFNKNAEIKFRIDREIDHDIIRDFIDAAHKISPLHIIRSRLVFSQFFLYIIFCIISLRIFDISLGRKFMGGRYVEAPAAGRADIYDASGEIIATVLPATDVYAEPRNVIDAKKAAKGLHQIFPDTSEQEFYDKLISKKGKVYLRRKISHNDMLPVNNLGEAAINFESSVKRFYSYSNLFSHILGVTDNDNNGISGIEKAYDADLKDGFPVVISMDAYIQDIIRTHLREGLKTYDAKSALAILTNVHTGEIIALIKYPDFNPNNDEKGNPEITRPIATMGLYEMGSTFKLFNTAAALDNGIVTNPFKKEYDTSKSYKIGGFLIKEPHPHENLLNAVEVLQYSSNIGSLQIALKMGAEKQKSFLRKMGLLDKVPISDTFQLTELAKPTPNDWHSDISVANISFGYGLQVTPLHLILAVNSLVNGGVYVLPRLLAMDDEELPTGFRVMKESTSDLMKHMMREVVLRGTARRANIKGYDVGGKTGTAKNTENGRYVNKYHTVFVGAFPMVSPKYSLLVMFDEPKKTSPDCSSLDASCNAVPVAGRIIADTAAMLGIEPVEEKEIEKDINKYQNTSQNNIDENQIREI